MEAHTQYGIVRSDAEYGVWPTGQPLPAGFHYTGAVGTRAEMEALLADYFVETVADRYYRGNGFAETCWEP